MSRRFLRAPLPSDAASIVALAHARRSPWRVATKAKLGAALAPIGTAAWLVTGDIVIGLALGFVGATIAAAAGIEALVILARVRCPCCDARVARSADRCARCSAPLR